MYDSYQDTLEHIKRVGQLLAEDIDYLAYELSTHDASKLQEPEKSAFDRETPLLKQLEYGSDDYKKALARLGIALAHHYKVNAHHPEHYETGIKGMSLLQILVMLNDWKAASERHATGDIYKSIEINQQRFGYSDELKQIFLNTAKEKGW